LCCFHSDPGQPVVLESRVTVGHHATVYSAYVETGALIGMGAVLLSGSRIGSRASSRRAPSSCRGDAVPPGGALFAGVPGRVIRDLTGKTLEVRGTPERYAHRAARHRAAHWDTHQSN
jgi:carbonic anhydrase/acetyltransferase-like protein (isoleucine patch superfamily)